MDNAHTTAEPRVAQSGAVLNISAYLFTSLNDCEELRERLFARAGELALKGTILLAPEGINLFLAGPSQAVHDFVATVREDARFSALRPKESYSDRVPFGKLLVKVKPEIIRMNHPAIRPQEGRAPAVSSETLLRWLSQGVDDEGREVVTLDTRNAFEVARGAFDNAIDWGITKFSEFPAAVLAHRDELRDKTVVSYCTGGIRCEKAAIYMREQGLEHVYQLEGGILKYLEETTGTHWRGECFVFDERVGVDAALAPTYTE
jgi:UPF0176 protein